MKSHETIVHVIDDLKRDENPLFYQLIPMSIKFDSNFEKIIETTLLSIVLL